MEVAKWCCIDVNVFGRYDWFLRCVLIYGMFVLYISDYCTTLCDCADDGMSRISFVHWFFYTSFSWHTFYSILFWTDHWRTQNMYTNNIHIHNKRWNIESHLNYRCCFLFISLHFKTNFQSIVWICFRRST